MFAHRGILTVQLIYNRRTTRIAHCTWRQRYRAEKTEKARPTTCARQEYRPVQPCLTLSAPATQLHRNVPEHTSGSQRSRPEPLGMQASPALSWIHSELPDSKTRALNWPWLQGIVPVLRRMSRRRQTPPPSTILATLRRGVVGDTPAN